MAYDVRIKELPPQTVTSARRRITASNLPAFLAQTIAELRGVLRDAGIPEDGAPFAIVHEKIANDREGEIEVCVPCAAGPVDAGVVETQRLPATRVAYADVPPDSDDARYPGIVSVYDAVAARILEDGRLLGDAPREIYGETATEVAWPIGGPSSGEHATITAS